MRVPACHGLQQLEQAAHVEAGAAHLLQVGCTGDRIILRKWRVAHTGLQSGTTWGCDKGEQIIELWAPACLFHHLCC